MFALSLQALSVTHTDASWALLVWSCPYAILRATWAALDAAELLFTCALQLLIPSTGSLMELTNTFQSHIEVHLTAGTVLSCLCSVSDNFFPISLINLVSRWHVQACKKEMFTDNTSVLSCIMDLTAEEEPIRFILKVKVLNFQNPGLQTLKWLIRLLFDF